MIYAHGNGHVGASLTYASLFADSKVPHRACCARCKPNKKCSREDPSPPASARTSSSRSATWSWRLLSFGSQTRKQRFSVSNSNPSARRHRFVSRSLRLSKPLSLRSRTECGPYRAPFRTFAMTSTVSRR